MNFDLFCWSKSIQFSIFHELRMLIIESNISSSIIIIDLASVVFFGFETPRQQYKLTVTHRGSKLVIVVIRVTVGLQDPSVHVEKIYCGLRGEK